MLFLRIDFLQIHKSKHVKFVVNIIPLDKNFPILFLCVENVRVNKVLGFLISGSFLRGQVIYIVGVAVAVSGDFSLSHLNSLIRIRNLRLITWSTSKRCVCIKIIFAFTLLRRSLLLSVVIIVCVRLRNGILWLKLEIVVVLMRFRYLFWLGSVLETVLRLNVILLVFLLTFCIYLNIIKNLVIWYERLILFVEIVLVVIVFIATHVTWKEQRLFVLLLRSRLKHTKLIFFLLFSTFYKWCF